MWIKLKRISISGKVPSEIDAAAPEVIELFARRRENHTATGPWGDA